MDDATAPISATPTSLARDFWNVPNQVTVLRMILSIVCFAFLTIGWFGVALVLFLLAAGTDWVDGYWARRFNQITQLGRILDPFADKLIICGVFIFLAAIPLSAIAPWMAVVVVARELLVTTLRSFFEQRDVDFSARWSGKWKMVVQCVAAALSMWRLTYYDPAQGSWASPPAWLDATLVAAVWLAVAMTVYSGWVYVRRGIQLLAVS